MSHSNQMQLAFIISHGIIIYKFTLFNIPIWEILLNFEYLPHGIAKCYGCRKFDLL